jgi:hypothetical protein
MRRALAVLSVLLGSSLMVLPAVLADTGSDPLMVTGEAEPSIDLSSEADINNYLTSIGIDPADLVVQEGDQNYAGPNCPGPAWTCTQDTDAVLQISSNDNGDNGDNGDDDDGDNVFVCSPQGDATTSDPNSNTCVIMQTNTTGTNRAVCREHNEQEEGTVEQTCTITQTNVSGPNIAIVDQSVVMGHDDTTQRSEQRSSITQMNGTGSNWAEVAQRSNLSAEAEEEGDVLQEQDAIQDSVVNQKTGCAAPTADPPVCPEPPLLVGVEDAGDNRARLYQSHRLEAEAEEAGSAEQFQNGETPTDIQPLPGSDCSEAPNVCSVVEQTSSDGELRIGVLQVQRHVAQAEDVELVTQQQGSSPFTGGLETVNHQDSFGLARRTKVQDERQFADVEDATGPSCPPAPDMPCQSQFTGVGPKANSNQEFHEDNFAFAAQNVIQLASDPFEQQATLEAFAGFASGEVEFRQFARQNDATEQQTVTGTGFVFAEIRCNQGGPEPPPTPVEPCVESSGVD